MRQQDSIDDFVGLIEKKTGHKDIPRPDWKGGRLKSRVIFVHHSPNKAAIASGFISGENKDQTAPCVMELQREAGINILHTIGWNLVPWPLPNPDKPGSYRKPNKKDGREGLPYLNEFLTYLPDLKVVFLLGNIVREFRSEIIIPDGAKIIECKMPTQQLRNLIGLEAWEEEVQGRFHEVANAIASRS